MTSSLGCSPFGPQDVYVLQRSPGRPHKLRCQAQRKLPETGYFAEADTKREVLPVAKKAEVQDFKTRGGRWESDFIWNIDWKEQLEYQEAQERRREEEAQKKAQAPSGFLSMNRLSDLNSLDSDVQEQLRRGREKDVERARQKELAAAQQRKRQQVYATGAEAKRWARSGRFTRRVVSIAPTNPEEQAQLEAQVAAEQERYDQLKLETQAWASFLAAGCFAAALAFYTREVAASYGAGALGGLIYLRLLNRSVDGVGSPTLGAALGQPRLLIPVILTGGYNRWNQLAAADTGLTLQLLPMLVGFFTYKLAVLGRQGVAVYQELYSPAAQGSNTMEDGQTQMSNQQKQQQQQQPTNDAISDDYSRQILMK